MSAYGGRARSSIYRDFPFSSSNSSIVLGIVIDCKSFIIFTIFIFKDSICRVCGYILFSLQPGNFKFPVLQTVLFETVAIAAQVRNSKRGAPVVGRIIRLIDPVRSLITSTSSNGFKSSSGKTQTPKAVCVIEFVVRNGVTSVIVVPCLINVTHCVFYLAVVC